VGYEVDTGPAGVGSAGWRPPRALKFASTKNVRPRRRSRVTDPQAVARAGARRYQMGAPAKPFLYRVVPAVAAACAAYRAQGQRPPHPDGRPRGGGQFFKNLENGLRLLDASSAKTKAAGLRQRSQARMLQAPLDLRHHDRGHRGPRVHQTSGSLGRARQGDGGVRRDLGGTYEATAVFEQVRRHAQGVIPPWERVPRYSRPSRAHTSSAS